MKNLITDSWKNILNNEFEKQYFRDIENFLKSERKS
jgi:uracil DNA glycosylase